MDTMLVDLLLFRSLIGSVERFTVEEAQKYERPFLQPLSDSVQVTLFAFLNLLNFRFNSDFGEFPTRRIMWCVASSKIRRWKKSSDICCGVR